MKKMNYDEMLAQAEAEAKKIRKKAQQREQSLQEAFVEWFDNEYPELRLLMHHSPNEAKRSGRTGATLKRMGMRAGFPDLILTMPSGIWCSLAIEVKEGKGSQRPEQKEYERVMLANNVCYIVGRDLELMKCAVRTYMKQGNMFQFVNGKVYRELIETSFAQRRSQEVTPYTERMSQDTAQRRSQEVTPYIERMSQDTAIKQ